MFTNKQQRKAKKIKNVAYLTKIKYNNYFRTSYAYVKKLHCLLYVMLRHTLIKQNQENNKVLNIACTEYTVEIALLYFSCTTIFTNIISICWHVYCKCACGMCLHTTWTQLENRFKKKYTHFTSNDFLVAQSDKNKNYLKQVFYITHRNLYSRYIVYHIYLTITIYGTYRTQKYLQTYDIILIY